MKVVDWSMVRMEVEKSVEAVTVDTKARVRNLKIPIVGEFCYLCSRAVVYVELVLVLICVALYNRWLI